MGVNKTVNPIPVDGDNHLSSFERKLWSLTYSCLYKFGCPVMFHTYGPNVPAKIDQTITFFVPSRCRESFQVIEYLKKELASEERNSQIINDEWWYGTHVEIKEFSGVDMYLEHEQVQIMAEKFMTSLESKLFKKNDS